MYNLVTVSSRDLETRLETLFASLGLEVSGLETLNIAKKWFIKISIKMHKF